MPDGPLRSEASGIRQEMPHVAGTRKSAGATPPDFATQLRAQQRRGWERGEPVPVEQLLVEHPEIVDDPECFIDLIYHEYLLQEQFGGRPELEAFVARFPEHAAALRMQIAFHRAVADAPIDAVPPRIAGDGQPHVPPAVSLENAVVPAFRGYEVLEEIGFGGAGVVYRARQLETNRSVALKVLSAGIHAGAVQRARFGAEAELIARLQHPNIVQIYEAGERDGCPYLVLEYIGGGNLRDRLQGVPQPPRTAARFLEVIARALQAAHAAGIVHRDLTPGNILFTGDAVDREPFPGIDVGQPKISDFGLAKSLGSDAATESEHRTMTGDVIGTPAYMSPEQARGEAASIGPATDIYALGAILYELLTGRPPHRGVTTVETLQRVAGSEPVPPSRLQPGLDADLETICLKCLQKVPAQRYAGAADLAEDLRRYLAGEPIVARPISPPVKLARWCRRKPLLAGLLAAVAVLLAVVVAGSITAAVRLNQAARERLAEAKLAEARVHRLDNQFGRTEKSLAALAEAALVRAKPDIRDEAIASLARFDLKFDRYFPATAGLIEVSADLSCYAQQTGSDFVTIRHIESDAEVCRIAHPTAMTMALFSPNSAYLACRWLNDPRIEVWSLADGAPRRVVADECASGLGIGAVNFSADGSLVAVGRPDGRVRIYRLDNGQQALEFTVPSKIAHLAFHPVRQQLAVATESNLQVRSTADGRLLILLEGGAGSEFLTWHPRGKILVASDRDSGLTLWEPDLLQSRRLSGHVSGGVISAFNHAGTLLFSTGWDGSLRVWDPQWGKPLFATIGSSHYYLRFSADDRYWAGDLEDGRLRIWSFPEAPAYRRLTPEGVFNLGFVHTLAVSSAGKGRSRLLAAAMEHGIGLWDLQTAHPAGHLPVGRISDLAFDDAGNLLTADTSGVEVWPIRAAADGEGSLHVGPPERLSCPGTLSQLACSSNGQVIGVTRRSAGGAVFHRDREEGVVALAPHEDVRSISLTPDGRLAATGAHNGSQVRIWSADDGTLLRELNMGSSRVAFSPDGRKLLTTGNGLQLWSVRDWQPLWQGAGNALSAYAFSPDGRLVAIDAATGRIIIYAAEDGRVIARLDDPYPTALHILRFSCDGRLLVGLSRDLTQMFVWNLDSTTRSLTRIGLTSELVGASSGEAGPAPLTVEVQLGDPDQRMLDDLKKWQTELLDQPGNGASCSGRACC